MTFYDIVYWNTYIFITFIKTARHSNANPSSLNKIAFEIVEILTKAGATIYSSISVQETIETCIDQDFTKAVKHLCRLRISSDNKRTSGLSNKQESKDVNLFCINCLTFILDNKWVHNMHGPSYRLLIFLWTYFLFSVCR